MNGNWSFSIDKKIKFLLKIKKTKMANGKWQMELFSSRHCKSAKFIRVISKQTSEINALEKKHFFQWTQFFCHFDDGIRLESDYVLVNLPPNERFSKNVITVKIVFHEKVNLICFVFFHCNERWFYLVVFL